MASIAQTCTPVIGQYMHPVVHEESNDSDAWQRKYYAPPPMKKLVERRYPLVDIRPLLSDAQRGSPEELLKSHGFGVVKHSSSLVSRVSSDTELPPNAIAEQYQPEMCELVRKTTGAKTVFVLASIVRQGKSVPETYKLPTGLKFGAGSETTGPPGIERDDKSVAEDGGTRENGANPGSFATTATAEIKSQTQKANAHKLAGQFDSALSAPVRVPHMDFTPLGARQTIRHQRQDIHETAVACGIIDAENALCVPYSVSATTEASDAMIAEQYNNSIDGRLGPRYAAYSIWRPLRKVERDPLTLAPRRAGAKLSQNCDEKVLWRYKNRIPGAETLGGDFLKEYAMLGVRTEEEDIETDSNIRPDVGKSESAVESELTWYYISNQQPDEILFIKLFDSAALGPDAKHADAPWHASPEIGDAEGVLPRESVELRVLAFW